MARKARLVAEFGLPVYDASVLAADKGAADFFEAAVAAYGGEPKTISNWISGELFRLIKSAGVEMKRTRVTPAGLAELASLVDQGALNSSTAREVLGEMFQGGATAGEIVQRRGLAQIADRETLEAAVTQVLVANPEQVNQYLGGKETIMQWLMGQVMRATGGQANPQMVLELLKRQLEAKRRKVDAGRLRKGGHDDH